MVGRALSPGEERLVFNFHIKSKVCNIGCNNCTCAGSSWYSGFWVEIWVEVLPVQYQLCTEELCDGLFTSGPCRSSSEAVMRSHIDNQCYQHRHLSCMYTFCVSLLSLPFSRRIFCSISGCRSLPLEHQSCFLFLFLHHTIVSFLAPHAPGISLSTWSITQRITTGLTSIGSLQHSSLQRPL